MIGKRATRRLLMAAAIAVVAVSICTGCRFDGVNSLPLPGNAVSGDGYRLHVQMADVQNLVDNSLVKYDNVTVGDVRRITVNQGVADVEIRMSDDVTIPRDVTVKLAQTSVLGAQYLELLPPADKSTRLLPGDTVPLKNSAAYPSTESVLAALSLVLNGSGLEQLRSIMAELNTATDGRTTEANQAIARLHTFVDGLDKQRDDTGRAIDALGRLSTTLAQQNATLASGIDEIDPALKILADQRADLTTMLDRVGDFGTKAAAVVSASKDDLAQTVASLKPTLEGLEKSGDDLTGGLLVGLTFPWPVTVVDKGLRGDYQNLFLTLDLSVGAIKDKVLGSIPAADLAKMMLSRQAADPLKAPLAAAAGGKR